MIPPVCLLERAPNFRDFGGLPTQDGRHVRLQRLYRSELLVGLSERDLQTLAALGIRLVCDLRSPAERRRVSNHWPETCVVETLALDLGGDLAAVQPDRWSRRLADPTFGATQAHEALLDNYRRMPTSYAGDLRALFEYLSRPDAGGVMIHCAAGKDRTGFVCAMLLWALGVDEETILDDYLHTRTRYTVERLMQVRALIGLGLDDQGIERAGQSEALAVLASVHPDFLRAALDAARAQSGSLDTYLELSCGLSPERRQALRGALLE